MGQPSHRQVLHDILLVLVDVTWEDRAGWSEVSASAVAHHKATRVGSMPVLRPPPVPPGSRMDVVEEHEEDMG